MQLTKFVLQLAPFACAYSAGWNQVCMGAMHAMAKPNARASKELQHQQVECADLHHDLAACMPTCSVALRFFA